MSRLYRLVARGHCAAKGSMIFAQRLRSTMNQTIDHNNHETTKLTTEIEKCLHTIK